MIKVFNCLTQEHDLRLVALAVGICLVACFAALTLVARGSEARRSSLWLLLSAIAFGSGTWSAHFISMLAYAPGIPIGFMLGNTVLSVIVATGGAGLGLALFIGGGRRPIDYYIGGIVLGTAVEFMHFIGLAAMRVAGRIEYDGRYVAAALLAGVVFAIAACYAAQHIHSLRARLAGAGLLGLAVIALHFIGMAAVTITPDPTVSMPVNVIEPKPFAVGIAVVASLALTLGLVAARLDRRVALQGERELTRFRQLADATFSGILVYRDGTILDVNAALCAFMGCGERDLIGHKVQEFIAPQNVERLAQRISSGQLENEEFTVVIKSGERRTVEVITRLIEYRGGPARLTALRDITERKRNELLHEGEHRILTGIAENRPLADVLKDVCLTAEAVMADAACSVLLLTEDGKHLKHGAAPNLPEAYCRAIDGIAIGPAVGSCGTAAYLKRPVYVEDIATDPLWTSYRDFTLAFGLRACWSIPLFARDGKVLGTFATYQHRPYRPTDSDLKVIDRFAASAAIAIQRAQLDQELVSARDRAEAASRAKSEFLANMSHELRTPLNAIMGFSEIIARQSLGADARERYIEYAGDIHDSGAYLLSLINDVLDVSRVEAGKVQIKPERCEMLAAVDEQLRVIRRAYPDAAEVKPMLGAGCPDLLADHRALGQVLLNVLGNAAKFTPPEGRVTITADWARPGLRLRVTDNGPGIPANMLKELGKPFRQVESAYNRRHPGTGLGLYISRSLMQLHGGELLISSTLGHGTTITLDFPEDCVIREDAVESSADKLAAAGE